MAERTADRTHVDKGEEGPRNFGVTLSQIGYGDLQAELGEELQALNKKLALVASQQGKAKGKLTLVLSILHEAKGLVTIDAEIKIAEPRRARARSIFFTTPGGNLSLEDPRQQKLPLRDVGGKGAERDAPADDDKPARSV
jgi:hypothetical protein